ncbi:MAG TPA: hypothetical protein DEO86_06170 [Colwellia sp.]|nr:hypothetical protein [Colwellia sp.]|tara:strand:+ start:3115 stop:3774 length:660 start_codon:yes stop_codon:yes gene_type:complete
MDSTEAKLKTSITPILSVKFEVLEVIPLDAPVCSKDVSFIEVLENRKSVREFTSVGLSTIGHLLYLSNRVKEASVNEFGHIIEKTSVATPGSLNATHCVLRSPENGSWYHYNARKHMLELIGVSEDELDKFAKTCFSLIPGSENSWLLWYINDIELLESKYDDPVTLAYRDAGGIATTHGLVCQYLGINFCQIGLHGNHEAQYILNERKLIGVGVALIG